MDIKQFVRSLVSENGTFSPFEIAENKGIIIQMEPLGTIRGYYSKALRTKFIHINCDLDEYQQKFTCAHELAHWVLHKKLYSGTGDVAAYNGNVSSDESHGIIERQADTLASALLMPLPQIKKCFYRLKIGRTDEQLIAEMANIFEVSKQAMQIRLKSRNLI